MSEHANEIGRWLLMNMYNGSSSSYRSRQGAIITKNINNGTWPRPDRCEICGRRPEETPPGRLQQHSEDYANPDRYVGICHRCHSRLHMRFLRPKNWTDLIALVDGSDHDLPTWARALALTPVDAPPEGSPPSWLTTTA